MEKLPEELLLQIVLLLDLREPPSKSCMLELPSAEALFTPEDAPLKNLSTVSRVLRRLVLPLLFKHLRIHLETLIELLVSANEGRSHEGICILPQSLEFLDSGPAVCDLAASAVIYEIAHDPPVSSVTRATHQLLQRFFTRMLRRVKHVTAIAPPPVLGILLDCRVSMADAWAFNIPYQRLDFARSSVGRTHGLRGIEEKYLLASQFWDEFSFNGHSCLPSYGTYHYFEKHPPSPLNAISPLSMEPFPGYELGYNVVEFSYTVLFPHVAHFRDVIHQISAHFNKLKHFRIRLAPAPDSIVWQDHDYIGRGSLNLRDCWSEIERCHDELMRRLVPGTFRLKYVTKVTIDDALIPSVGLQLDSKFNRIGGGWVKQDDVTWEIVRPQ